MKHTKMQYSIDGPLHAEAMTTSKVSPLSVWCFFYPNKRAVTFCFSDSSPPSSSVSLGEALQHGPFQQLLPHNKNIVLILFYFPPLHLSGAITLPSTELKSTSCTSLLVVLQLFGFVAVQRSGRESCSHCGLLVTVVYVVITLSISPLKTKNEAPKYMRLCQEDHVQLIHLFILKASSGGRRPSDLLPTFELYNVHMYIIFKAH